MTHPSDRAAEAEQRRRIREFVRENHPDRGGDPHRFAEGLAALRAGRGLPASPADRVTVHHRRRGPGVFVDWAQRRWTAHRRPPRVQ